MPDTSCIVAAICSWHEHHERAIREIQTRLNRRQRMVIAGPALIESYSVLTRLPAPHRISPADAHHLLETNFMKGRKVVALGAAAYQSFLRAMADDGIAGGRVYDAIIAACARKARAQTLLTFNTNHFDSLAGSDMEVVAP